MNYTFFNKQHHQKLAKSQAEAEEQPEAELLLFENF